MDTRRKLHCVIKALAAVLALLLVACTGYFLYQRISIDEASLSPTQRIIKAYADENSILFRSYPESLVALLERNPETETFVLEYPLKKNQKIDVDLSDYKGVDGVALFLQWEQQWGYL